MEQQWFKVRITFEDDAFEDEIKGLDPDDALKNAWWNWSNARDIELIS